MSLRQHKSCTGSSQRCTQMCCDRFGQSPDYSGRPYHYHQKTQDKKCIFSKVCWPDPSLDIIIFLSIWFLVAMLFSIITCLLWRKKNRIDTTRNMISTSLSRRVRSPVDGLNGLVTNNIQQPQVIVHGPSFVKKQSITGPNSIVNSTIVSRINPLTSYVSGLKISPEHSSIINSVVGPMVHVSPYQSVIHVNRANQQGFVAPHLAYNRQQPDVALSPPHLAPDRQQPQGAFEEIKRKASVKNYSRFFI